MPAKRRTRAIAFARATFKNPAGGAWRAIDPTSMRVQYRLAGSPRVLSTTLREWTIARPDAMTADWLDNTSQFRSAKYLAIDEKRRTATVRPGRWILRENLIVPKGYGLFATAGAALDLRDALTKSSGVEVFFVFMHELLWLSENSAYRKIRANSRSRRGNLQAANYWRDVHPLLVQRAPRSVTSSPAMSRVIRTRSRRSETGSTTSR